MTDVRMLQAPGDPGDAGLLVVLAIVLVLGLALAHVRVLRAVARAARADGPGDVAEPNESERRSSSTAPTGGPSA